MEITTHMGNTGETTQRMHVDMSHTNRLSGREHTTARIETEEFLRHITNRYVDDAYLHLDVKRVKETRRGLDGLKWKALLVTNKGRFVAEQIGFGVFHSLHTTFDALEGQLRRIR